MSSWAKGGKEVKDPKKCKKCKTKAKDSKSKKKKKSSGLDTHGVQSQIVQMELDLETAKNLLFALTHAIGGELKKKGKKKKKGKWVHGGKPTRRIKLRISS